MRIAFQYVISLLLFAFYNYVSLADDEKMDIVGFFEEQDSQEQLAFDTAITIFNTMKKGVVFNSSEVIYDGDSFASSNFLCNITVNGNGIAAVFARSASKIMESICVNLEIPIIQVDWRPTTTYRDSVIVNLHPYPKLLFQGLGVIVQNLQWRSIVIFYESKENLIRLQDILKVQNYDGSSKFNSILVKELGPGPDYRSALKQIQNKSEHRIILDCKTENVIQILKQAKELKLLEPHFNYFLTSLDAHTLNFTVLETSANITTVRIIDPKSENFQYALSRWKRYANASKAPIHLKELDEYSVKTETALIYDAVNLYTTCVKDLHVQEEIKPRPLNCDENFATWKDGYRIASFMKSHNYESGDPNTITGPMHFDTLGRRTNFTIHVVEGNRDDVTARWNPSNPKTLQFLKSDELRNKELEEKWSQGTVRVASILGAPYLMEKKPTEEGQILEDNAKYEGFSMDLIAVLASELKIKYKFEVLESGDRGTYDKDTKTWNGLIREVLDRRAELAICDLTITPDRREVVDFSTPFMRLGISILYKKADQKAADMYAFLDPLSFDLWIYSATLYLAITVVIYFISRLSPDDWENPHPCDQEPEELENIWDMKNCLWLTLGAIMNQGCDILPKGISSRMAASMWWFFAIIVTNSYMANLAAFLTNERSQGSINSAEDLAKQTKVKYGTLDKGSTQGFFRESNYSIYQRMWTSMQQSKPSVFEKSNTDGVARVRNTKNRQYAFLMESSTLEYEIQTKCDLKQVGNWLDSKGYGIAMPLDFPHRTRINKALLKLQEEGKINELKDKWWKTEQEKKAPLCPKDNEDDADASKLALQNVGGVFVVLGVGIALSYIVAIAEFLWNVRNVSVEEHISFKQALKVEVLFALNVFVTKKRVKPQISESSSSSGGAESRSMAHSILQGASSFLRLDILSKTGTPGSSRHTSRPID